MTSKNIDLQVLRAMASYYAQAIEVMNFRADGTRSTVEEAMQEVSDVEYTVDRTGAAQGVTLRMREARADVTVDLWNLRVTVRRDGDIAEAPFRWTEQVDRLEMSLRGDYIVQSGRAT